jgi:hypothetical protein
MFLIAAGLAARLLAGDSVVDAEKVLAAARRRLADERVVLAIRTIETEAACQGPRYAYETHVASARDGRALFEQRFPDGRIERSGLGLTSDWAVGSDGAVAASGLIERTMIQGHEIHMLVIAPETRFGRPRGARDTVFEGRAAIALVFHDTLGAPVVEFFARSDSLPLGFAFVNHHDNRPPPILTIDAWRRVGRIRLPARATYHQGSETYAFRFTRIALNATVDSVFQRPHDTSSRR